MVNAAVLGSIDWLPSPALPISFGRLAGCVPGDPYDSAPYPPSGKHHCYRPSPAPHHYRHWRYRAYRSYPAYRRFP